MHVISGNELAVVSGGGDIADAAQAGGALGGALGVGYAWAQGATGTAVAGLGGIGALAGAGLGASLAGGWAIGTWINENTPIQDWISEGIDAWANWEPFGS